MLTLNATQQALVDSTSKIPYWSFIITDINSVRRYWSNQAYTITGDGAQWATGEQWASGEQWADGTGGTGYAFKILDFPGLKFNRNKNELGMVTPSDGTFKVSNSGNTLTASDFDGGDLWINCEISDGTNIATIGRWRFRIKKCDHNPDQTLTFHYETYLQKYLEGTYPNTRYHHGLFPSGVMTADDNMCVPVICGSAYIPLRLVESGTGQGYLLGPAANTYTIDRVRAPRSWSNDYWLASGYTMTQISKTGSDGVSYKLLQPIIADNDNDGTADSSGKFGYGEVLDMPCKFTSSETSALTNPADFIAFVLQDYGMPAAEIDLAGTFTTVAASLTSKGISWNFGLWYKEDRKKVLAKLLTMCHCGLRQGEKLEIYEKSKTSVKTITSTEIMTQNPDGTGPAIFSRNKLTGRLSDSGYIAYQPTNEAQDKFVKYLVPAKGTTTDYEDSEVLEIPAIQDSQKAQKIGTLYFQRKLMKVEDIAATVKGTCMALQCDDVITFNDAAFGGSFNCLIDSVNLNLDLSVNLSCTGFGVALDDWADLNPSAITINADNTTVYWTPTITGPLSDKGIAQNYHLQIMDEWVFVSPKTNKGKFTTIAAALTYIDNSPADSGRIYVKNGTYNTGQITMPLSKNITIEGETVQGVIFNTTINNDLFRISGATTSNFDFSKFSISISGTGTPSYVYGFYILGSGNASNILLSNVSISSTTGQYCQGLSSVSGEHVGSITLQCNSVQNCKYGFVIGTEKALIINNSISIALDINGEITGIVSNQSDGIISGNNIYINNPNVGAAANRYGMGVTGDRNIISNNQIDCVNNTAKDYGISLNNGADNNQGSDNITYNVGTSILDSGTGNTVTAKDV